MLKIGDTFEKKINDLPFFCLVINSSSVSLYCCMALLSCIEGQSYYCIMYGFRKLKMAEISTRSNYYLPKGFINNSLGPSLSQPQCSVIGGERVQSDCKLLLILQRES
jgi:hypothetical protein